MAPPGSPTTSLDNALRKQFPILERPPYLNHAGIAPWPRAAAEAAQAFAEENLREVASNYPQWIRRESALRDDLATLTGAASADDIALLKNTTEGISLVAWGLDWKEGDNVVLPRGEFPSNRLPWLAQARRGVEVREIDIRETEDAEAALIGAMDERTRLVTVSAVQWSDGFRLDLPELGAACRSRGAWFFVDGIQQLGALPLSVVDCGVHFLSADAHKWMLGPEGIAVFYCCEEGRQALDLSQQGWHMFEDPFHFARDDWTPTDSARRFEAGSPNSMGQAAMHASVRMLLDHGMQRVGQRVLHNTECLADAVDSLPHLRLTSRREQRRRSGILSFQSELLPAREIYRKLSSAGVACALRGDSVRLSPHFYQGEAVMEEFIGILKKL
ncbi:MAG: aminotransferase class V-fold PLP-dependent enzyme [Lysobacterales bacterium]|jgi:selenocysteine lyase/cysteine desulfurase